MLPRIALPHDGVSSKWLTPILSSVRFDLATFRQVNVNFLLSNRKNCQVDDVGSLQGKQRIETYFER